MSADDEVVYCLEPVTAILSIFAVLFGLAFGSFLNVCIYRLPRHLSVAHPRSRCPHCLTPIAAKDNIPILSWLLLRGRCRHCRGAISPRYLLVEFATAALFLLCLLRFGFGIQAIGMVILCFLLLGLAAMDADTLLLPDAFTLPGLLLGVGYSALLAGSAGSNWLRAAGISLLGAVGATAVIVGIRGVYWLIRRTEGMGLGDAKLLAVIAAWLGPWNTVLTLFLAVVSAALYGLAALSVERSRASSPSGHPMRIPLGSFLCAAAIFTIFLGPQVIAWYLQFFR